MPEGPELKNLCDGLQIFKNELLTNFNILSGRYKKDQIILDNYNEFNNDLPCRINSISVKGKLLYFILDNEWVILNTMGMSGRWTKKYQKHCHLELIISDKKIWFCDPRRFGTIKIFKDLKLLKKKLDSIGPDLLNSKIDEKQFIEIMRKHQNKNITKVLMNQSIMSGCGNYIKSESLYRAGISPHNNIIDLNDQILIKLLKALQNVMQESYKSKGATISTYYNFNDDKGSFNFKVYGKKIDDHGNEIVKEKTLDGRTTHWVKNIQI